MLLIHLANLKYKAFSFGLWIVLDHQTEPASFELQNQLLAASGCLLVDNIVLLDSRLAFA